MKYFKPCSEGGMMSGIIIVDEAIDSITFHGLITIPGIIVIAFAIRRCSMN